MHPATSLTLLLSAFCVLLVGCGGGGGSSGASAVTPPPTTVQIGSVSFDPTTSTDFSKSTLAFPMTPAPAAGNFSFLNGVGTLTPHWRTQAFTTTSILVGSVALPCIAYHALNYGTAPGDASDYQELWAVDVTGALYHIADQAPATTPPVLLAAPRLIVPANVNLTAGFTNPEGWFGADLWSAYLGGTDGRVLTVISLNATSPHGFLNCVQFQIVAPTGAPAQVQVIDSYWQPGVGCVDVQVDPGTSMSLEWFRNDVAFPG